MNLVLSGPIDSSLLATVEGLSRPTRLHQVNQDTWRLQDVDDGKDTRGKVAACCNSATVDHAYVRANLRFSDIKLLAIDMDSTLITIECIDELADFAGKRSEVEAITEATMRGEIPDFAESLKRRVALLAGLNVDVLRQVYEERLHLSPGAEELISTAKANGTYLLLLSGGFTYFAERLKRSLGFNNAFANQLGTRSGSLTGCLVGTTVDASFKAAKVKDAISLLRCTCDNAVAIGDGANDIPMMRCVSQSVAYRAKSLVQEQATICINHGSLATLLQFFEQ